MTKYCACHEKWHCNSSCGHKRPKLAVTSDQNLRSQATPRPLGRDCSAFQQNIEGILWTFITSYRILLCSSRGTFYCALAEHWQNIETLRMCRWVRHTLCCVVAFFRQLQDLCWKTSGIQRTLESRQLPVRLTSLPQNFIAMKYIYIEYNIMKCCDMLWSNVIQGVLWVLHQVSFQGSASVALALPETKARPAPWRWYSFLTVRLASDPGVAKIERLRLHRSTGC